jgi:hypothetical protein
VRFWRSHRCPTTNQTCACCRRKIERVTG